MDLRHLRYFIALAERLSFTRAAASVHVTQSTLSHQIRNLEEELGCALFERSSRAVELTAAGRAFLPGALLTLSQLDLSLREAREAAEGIHAAHSELTGEIRLLVGTHGFGVGMLPSCLQQFAERHPKVHVVREEVPAAHFIPRLKSGQYDFGCGDEPPTGEGLVFQPLYRQELILAVPPNHPLVGRASVRMIELHSMPMALISEQVPTRQYIDQCLRISGARPQVIAELSQPYQLIPLALRANLAIIVTRNSEDIMKGLTQIPLKDPTPFRTLGLLWKSDREISKAARAFSEHVRQSLQTPPEEAPEWLRVEAYKGPSVIIRSAA
jgi:LysR family cyn operon transcriptional activator